MCFVLILLLYDRERVVEAGAQYTEWHKAVVLKVLDCLYREREILSLDMMMYRLNSEMCFVRQTDGKRLWFKVGPVTEYDTEIRLMGKGRHYVWGWKGLAQPEYGSKYLAVSTEPKFKRWERKWAGPYYDFEYRGLFVRVAPVVHEWCPGVGR